VASSKTDKGGKAFNRNGIAIVDVGRDGITHGSDFHCLPAPFLQINRSRHSKQIIFSHAPQPLPALPRSWPPPRQAAAAVGG
jgi:hypothetical protein